MCTPSTPEIRGMSHHPPACPKLSGVCISFETDSARVAGSESDRSPKYSQSACRSAWRLALRERLRSGISRRDRDGRAIAVVGTIDVCCEDSHADRTWTRCSTRRKVLQQTQRSQNPNGIFNGPKPNGIFNGREGARRHGSHVLA